MVKQTFAILIIFFLFLIFSSLQADETGKLTGYVSDANSGDPLPHANVVLKGTNLGGAADTNGRFVLRKIPIGKYTVRVTRIGYASVEHEVRIDREKMTTLNVRLEAEAVKFNEVLVTATRDRALRSEVAVATEIISRS
jgi:hypothetical protein